MNYSEFSNKLKAEGLDEGEISDMETSIQDNYSGIEQEEVRYAVVNLSRRGKTAEYLMDGLRRGIL